MTTDPMAALLSLQRSVSQGNIVLHPGRVHADLGMHFDNPNGRRRLLFAKTDRGSVGCIVLLVEIGHIGPYLTFQLCYAVRESKRRQGLASTTVALAIDEHTQGLKRAGIVQYGLEAVVGSENVPSNALARKIFSNSPEPIMDSFSGEAALRYHTRIG